MTKTIRREILIPQPREQVWRALTDSIALAEWMYPNDFEPRVGHHFTFRVPPNPKVGFDGIIVYCEVIECEPPSRLTYSWPAEHSSIRGCPTNSNLTATARALFSNTPALTSPSQGANRRSGDSTLVTRKCSDSFPP